MWRLETVNLKIVDEKDYNKESCNSLVSNPSKIHRKRAKTSELKLTDFIQLKEVHKKTNLLAC